MSKKVLILGGTGILGRVLCNYLLNANYEVVMFNRGLHKNVHEQAVVIKGDRRKKVEIEKPKDIQVNAVIDTMGWYSETLNTIFELFTGKICSYVFISSLGVYGRGRDLPYQEAEWTPIHEESRLGELYIQKMACEKVCKLAYEHGFPITVLRPAYLFTDFMPFTREKTLLDCLLRKRKIYVPDNKKSVLQFISTTKLVEVCVDIIKNPTRYQRNYSYNIAETKKWDMEEWIFMIAELVDISPRIERVSLVSGSNKEFLYYPENITVNCDNLRQVFQGELDVMTRDYVRKLLVELI